MTIANTTMLVESLGKEKEVYGFILVIFMSGGNFTLQGFDDMNQCQYVESYFKTHPYYHHDKKVDKIESTMCTRERVA